jgi:hypothetical protein
MFPLKIGTFLKKKKVFNLLANDDLSLELHSTRKHSEDLFVLLVDFFQKIDDHLNTHLTPNLGINLNCIKKGV